jgi:hypothetical protein
MVLVQLLVLIIVFAVVWVIIEHLPLPDPFGLVARLVLLLIALLTILAYLVPGARVWM